MTGFHDYIFMSAKHNETLRKLLSISILACYIVHTAYGHTGMTSLEVVR